MTSMMKRKWGSTLVVLALPFFMGMTGMTGMSGCPTTPTGDTGSDQGDRKGIYVSNFGGKSITVYSLDASGDAAPIRTISGEATGIGGPLGIARDSEGKLYVCNRSAGTVTVYPLTGNGNITPTRILADADMGSPEGIVIANTDEVFVSNCPTLGGLGGTAGVFHFGNDATAPDYKIAGANTGITVPVGLALDEARDLFVANAFGGTVALFAPGQTGDQFPTRSFNPGGNTQSIAYGSASILLGMPSGINTYHSAASGDTAWVGQINDPISYTGGIYFDTDVTPPVIYVADFGSNSVHVIQTVGVPPFLSIQSVTTINGPNTKLESPYGIVVVKV
ncbi:MAG: hypothetical protein AABZ08_02595 [Planctomycetota bacterium]